MTGRLEIYLEDGYQFLHLVDSELLWEENCKPVNRTVNTLEGRPMRQLQTVSFSVFVMRGRSTSR